MLEKLVWTGSNLEAAPSIVQRQIPAAPEEVQVSLDSHREGRIDRTVNTMIENTLVLYGLEHTLSTAEVRSMLDRNGISFYYEEITEGGASRNDRGAIDLGEKPVSTVLKPKEMLSPEERKASEVMFLPPRPGNGLAVVTYSECSPMLELREY